MSPHSSIVPLSAVEYLVFGGGGGRGLVHLGAIQAIQSGLKERSLFKAGSVKGFGGASAGGLLAMMLALGYSAQEIRYKLDRFFGAVDVDVPAGARQNARMPRIVSDAIYEVSGSEFGRKAIGEAGLEALLLHRIIKDNKYFRIGAEDDKSRNTQKTVIADIHANLFLRESFANDAKLAKRLDQWDLVDNLAAGIVVRKAASLAGSLSLKLRALAAGSQLSIDDVAQLAYEFIHEAVKDTDFKFVTRSRGEFDRVLYNMLFHNGLLPGSVLRESVRRAAAESPVCRGMDVSSLDRFTFEDLWQRTKSLRGTKDGVELLVVGTNLRTKTVQYFSRRHTPNFPVVDAVAISMTYPFLFKPVLVRYKDPSNSYYGDWVDGGLLNNVPIHSFDTGPALNYKVVAFMIDEKRDYSSATTGQDMIAANLRTVLDALLAQASDGQIRTEVEALQTVRLSAGGLSTMDLIPNWRIALPLIRDAEARVNEYFKPRTACFDVAARWARQKADPDPPIQGVIFQELARNQLRGTYEHVSPRPLWVEPYQNKLKQRVSENKRKQSLAFEVDIVATNSDRPDHYVLYEAKASRTARLSKDQKDGIKLVAKFGGYLISVLDSEEYPSEKPIFPIGAEVEAHVVRIVRPGNLCGEFHAAQLAKRDGTDLPAQSAEWRGRDFPEVG